MNCETAINRSVGIDPEHGGIDPEHIATLLERYPTISDRERSLVLAFLREGRWLDIGLLSSRDSVKPKLRDFQRDHARQLGLQWKDYLLVVFLVSLLLIACVYLWDSAL